MSSSRALSRYEPFGAEIVLSRQRIMSPRYLLPGAPAQFGPIGINIFHASNWSRAVNGRMRAGEMVMSRDGTIRVGDSTLPNLPCVCMGIHKWKAIRKWTQDTDDRDTLSQLAVRVGIHKWGKAIRQPLAEVYDVEAMATVSRNYAPHCNVNAFLQARMHISASIALR